ncbi:MAG: hypothetical protein ACOVQA_04140 [Thermoflexibacteraceae bacterium]
MTQITQKNTDFTLIAFLWLFNKSFDTKSTPQRTENTRGLLLLYETKDL